jgi:hypothetical protein
MALDWGPLWVVRSPEEAISSVATFFLLRARWIQNSKHSFSICLYLSLCFCFVSYLGDFTSTVVQVPGRWNFRGCGRWPWHSMSLRMNLIRTCLSFFCKELSQGFLGGLHVSWFNLGLLIAGDCSISWNIWDGEHLNICLVWLSLCAPSLCKWNLFVLSFWFLWNIVDWAKCAWFDVHLGFYV